jgi:DNA modification methylase
MKAHYVDESVTLHHGDAIEVLRSLPDASVDAVVTDPPYGLEFMGREWDSFKLIGDRPGIATMSLADGSSRSLPVYTNGRTNPTCRNCGGTQRGQDRATRRRCACDAPDFPPTRDAGAQMRAFQQWCGDWARECLRVLKPGGHLLAFGGTRTVHRLTCAIEDAGFEIRDGIDWLYGCLDDQTEIMIDGQWEPYHKVKQGHHALGYDIERDEFSWQPIQRVVVFPYSDTAYRLVGDHTDQLVTREHRCIVERGGSYVFEEAQEAARERQARVPVVADVRGLLDALPLPHQGTGRPPQDLLKDVRRPTGRRSEQWTPECQCEPAADVSRVPEVLPAFANQAARGSGSGVLAAVSREAGRRSDAGSGVDWPGGVDGYLCGFVPGEDDRAGEPRVEGRSDLLPQAWQLQASQIRPVPVGASRDGAQRRLRDGAPAVGGEGNGQAVGAARSGSPRGSRPDQQRSCQPVAVQDQSGPQTVRGARHTSTDLVRITAEHYDGIAWCVTVPTGAFVARRNGKVFVTGNSGFPKSLNVSKAIDKARNDRADWLKVTSWLADRAEAAGVTRADIDQRMGTSDMGGWWLSRLEHRCALPTLDQWDRLRELIGFSADMDAEVLRLNLRKGEPGEAWADREVLGARTERRGDGTVIGLGHTGELNRATSEIARQWSGWGTALKPAREPIVMGRKPLAGTVAANVLAYGTGALNIDACRTAAGQDYREKRASVVGLDSNRNGDAYGEWTGVRENSEHSAGRWPTNVVLSHAPLLEDGEPVGDACADGCVPGCPVAELDAQSGVLTSGANPTRRGSDKFRDSYGDFKGQNECVPARGADSGGASRFFPVFRYEAKAPTAERPRTADGTAHPTVKPLDLMRWLVRLVTPPGGTVLEPFAGSGTTAEACVIEGFRCIAIEREAAYLPLITARLSKPIPLALFGGVA